jgi:hypothetical protein
MFQALAKHFVTNSDNSIFGGERTITTSQPTQVHKHFLQQTGRTISLEALFATNKANQKFKSTLYN